MKNIAMTAVALLSTVGIASGQVTSPTPGQPGAQVAPGMPNSGREVAAVQRSDARQNNTPN